MQTEVESLSKIQAAFTSKSVVSSLIGVLRKFDKTEITCFPDAYYEMLLSLVILGMEQRQLKQISTRMIFALAENCPERFNKVLLVRKFIPLEPLLYMILHCNDIVKFIQLQTMKSFWENWFICKTAEQRSGDITFIFGCRAFNTYVGQVAKFKKTCNRLDVVNDKTFLSILSFASNSQLSRDSRQVN